MSRDVELPDIDRRARTAGYADGLLDLFASAVLTILALGWVVNPGLIGILAAFIVLYGWKLVERVKERITYPRIGYFREKADEQSTNARGMLLFIAGAVALMVLVVWLAGDVSDSAEWRRAAPLVSGISLTGGFWYAGEKSGLWRYRWIAALSLVGGIALWALGSGESYSAMVWHLLGLAVPLALTGSWSLARFVRTHPVRETAVDG
jgi:amino acid transporter